MFIPCRRCGKDTYIVFVCAHGYCPECCFEWCEHPKNNPSYPENWKGDPHLVGRIKK